MKYIYLHVGFPKTGTTYLQKNYFKKNKFIQNFGKNDNLRDIDKELMDVFKSIIHVQKIKKIKKFVKILKSLELDKLKKNLTFLLLF